MEENDKFPLQQFLPYLLNQAAEESSLEFQKAYKDRYGMLRTEWRVLYHLGIYGRMTAKDIGLRSKMHKTKISRAVHRLAQRRYLTRTQDDNDRRLEHLDLTPTGRAAYLDLRGIAEDYDARLSSILTNEENRVLRQALLKLARM